MGSKNERKPIMYYNGKPVGYIEDIPQMELDGFTTDEEAKKVQQEFNESIRQLELLNAEMKGEMKCVLQYQPKKILKSGNRTIVFWADNTKTIVKRAEDEPDNDYAAFTAALGIKLFKSNSALKKLIERKTIYQKVSRRNNGTVVQKNVKLEDKGSR